MDYDNNQTEVAQSLSWDAGAPVTLDYAGSAPDIGAYRVWFRCPGNSRLAHRPARGPRTLEQRKELGEPAKTTSPGFAAAFHPTWLHAIRWLTVPRHGTAGRGRMPKLRPTASDSAP